MCVKGKARRDPNDECEEYCNLIYIPIIVVRKGASVISCSADYNNPDSKAYKDLVPNYVKNVCQLLQTIDSTFFDAKFFPNLD